MVEIVEMDKRITLDKQLEEDIDPVILINEIHVNPEDSISSQKHGLKTPAL